MTLRHIDGWDYLPAAPTNAKLVDLMEANGYFFDTKPADWTVETGRFGFGNCLRLRGFPGGGIAQVVKPIEKITSNLDEATVGLAVYVGEENDGHCGIMFFDAISDTPQISVTLDEYGIIRVFRGHPTNGEGRPSVLIGWSRAGSFYNEEWWYFEVKAGIDAVNGYCQVRVNTKIVVDLVDVNTLQSTIPGFDSLGFVGGGVQGETYDVKFDDNYLLDLTGSVNNNYLGNVRVKTQFTSGAGSLTQWTPSGVLANWETAQNRNMDDTAYNEENTVGQADFYEIQAIINASVVYAVQVKSGLRQTDATQRIAHNRINSNSVIAEGADHYLNQDFYTFYNDIFELNPDTGVGFTGAEVNLLEIGPEVQA